jgi:nucleoid-associated protein YgaU
MTMPSALSSVSSGSLSSARTRSPGPRSGCAGKQADRESSVPAATGGRRAGAGAASAPRVAAITVLALGILAGAGTGTALAADRFPITPTQRDVAEKVAANGVALSDLAPNAPSSYTIKRGDTLWSIATLFLKSPWRWPELWGMNRTQIRNPHLIYPGQTLLLVKTADGRAQLVLAGTNVPAPAAAAAPAPAPAAPEAPPVPTEKLIPHARELDAGATAAIPSIPNNAIEPFLSRPNIVAADELEKYPRIVSTQQDRVYLGAGDTAYARGVDGAAHDGSETYHVFRPARPLYDPEDFGRKAPIAFEAKYLGTARLVKGGPVATLTILESKQEIGVGDRLVPIEHQELINYVPRRPDKNIEGRIVSVYGGVASVGAGDIVTLNRGRKDGLEIGNVLAVLHNGQTIVDRTAPGHEKVKLPDEDIGHLFVFRLFDGISYALLVSASGPVQVGDRFDQPDSEPTPGAAAPAASAAP